MRYQQQLLTLADRDLYFYQGLQEPHPLTIYQFYEHYAKRNHPKPLVLTLEEDFEFCDVLDLMFGVQASRVPIWAWHDEFWDRLHDKRAMWTADTLLAGVVCDRYDLATLARRPHKFDRIKRQEEERRIRNQHPSSHIDPLYFTEFF